MATLDLSDPSGHAAGNRFVVLRHDVGPCCDRTKETHLDWMFATGEALATWSTKWITDLENSFTTSCQKLADHRLIYLDREGDLGEGRGSVHRMIAGEYMQVTSALAEVTFKAKLCWQTDCGVNRGLLEIVQRWEEKVPESEPSLELHLSIAR